MLEQAIASFVEERDAVEYADLRAISNGEQLSVLAVPVWDAPFGVCTYEVLPQSAAAAELPDITPIHVTA